jgi:hypothetical protein
MDVIYSSNYTFTRTPAQTLTGGSPVAINLTPLPDGLSTTYSPNKHYLRIIDAVNGNETVLVTALAGTLATVQPALSHTSGNWSIQSATDGIQEALNVAGASGGQVVCPARNGGSHHLLYGTITMHGGQSLVGEQGASLIRFFAGTEPTIKQVATGTERGGGIYNFRMGYNASADIDAAAYMIDFRNVIAGIISNVYMSAFGSGIYLEQVGNLAINVLIQEYFKGTALKVNGATINISVWNARNDNDGVKFYHSVASICQVDNFEFQGGGLACENTYGIYTGPGEYLSENIWTNGIMDTITFPIRADLGCAGFYNNLFSNIEMLTGQLRAPCVVNTNGTAVTWVSGYLFTGISAGQPAVINGVAYEILTNNSSTSLTLTSSAGVQSGVSGLIGGRWTPIIVPPVAENAVFENINMYGPLNRNGIVAVYGGNGTVFDGLRLRDIQPDIGGSIGLILAGAVNNFSLLNSDIGYTAGAPNPASAHALVIGNFAHTIVRLANNNLYGATNNATDLGSGSYLRMTPGSNVGIDDKTVGVTASAGTLTLPMVTNINLTGTQTISTITGYAPGRIVNFYKGDAGTITFSTGGNLGAASTLTSAIGSRRFVGIGGVWWPQ